MLEGDIYGISGNQRLPAAGRDPDTYKRSLRIAMEDVVCLPGTLIEGDVRIALFPRFPQEAREIIHALPLVFLEFEHN